MVHYSWTTTGGKCTFYKEQWFGKVGCSDVFGTTLLEHLWETGRSQSPFLALAVVVLVMFEFIFAIVLL